MLRFAAIALVAAISAVGVAQVSKAFAINGPGPQAQQAQALVAEVPAQTALPYGQAASITKSRDGHFWAEAAVDGKQVRFLVDTGATTVALSAADADRLGLSRKDLDYRYEVNTANGKARAAAVTLASVSVAGARVDDVDAMVIEKGLDTSLLGMSYLGRLSSMETRGSSLILRP
jgi:aspartyl protease family protein